jgi:hypothetical protein
LRAARAISDRPQLRRDRPDHAGDDLVLKLEELIQGPVEPVGPKLIAGGGLDQLRG